MQSRRTWPQLTSALTLSGAGLCLALGLIVQRYLDRPTSRALPILLLGAAGLAFAALVRGVRLEAEVDAGNPGQTQPASIVPVALALAISVLGCLNFGGNRFRPVGVAVWVAGLVLALLYLWLISPGPDTRAWLRSERGRKQVWLPAAALALAAIVALGAWFRLRLNGEIPLEMGFDLASKYFDALSIARGEYAIFFPARLGREGLFFYGVALVGRLAGMSKATLHLTSALFGTVTIIAVFFLAQEMYGRTAGLLAAALLAVNRWHIVLSRSGFRAATMPLFTALALHAFVRALRTRRPLDWGWAGVAVGIGIYSYRSFLFVPVAMALGLLLYLLSHGLKQSGALVPGLVVMALIAAAIAAPLGRYVVENPGAYLARERYQVQAMEKHKAESPGTLAYYVRGLLAFNYRGDADSRFNVPYARQMGLVSGVLLVLGLALALWRWRRGYNALPAVALLVLILPAALSMLPDEMASALRLSGAVVPAVVLAALPVAMVAQRAARRPQVAEAEGSTRRGFGMALSVEHGAQQRTWTWHPDWEAAVRWALAAAVVLLLAYEAAETRRFYFRDYVTRLPEMANYSMPAAIADEIKDFGDLQSVYIRPWPNWFDSSVLKLHLGTDPGWNPFVETLAADQPPLSTLDRAALFIVNAHDEASLAALRAALPRGIAQVHTYPNGELAFYAFYGEP